MIKLLLVLILLTSACTPAEVQTWLDLHGLPATTDVKAAGIADALTDAPGIRGWVNLGNGIYGPPVLAEIRRCESGDDYTIRNRAGSSARGAYQFLTSSWRAYGHADRYGVKWASMALPWQQDEAAVITWLRSGTSPWNPSRGCWN